MTDQAELYHVLDFADFSGNLSDEFTTAVKAALNSRGILVVNNIDLTEEDYVKLTASLGEPVDLPDFLVPAKLPGHAEIARVANFSADETARVDPAYKFGAYWHHDGNFWPEGRHRIVNFLHSKIVPEKGGDTAFISTRKAFDLLSSEERTALAGLQITVDPRNIEDFRDTEELRLVFGNVEHPVLCERAGTTSLYVPFFKDTITGHDGRVYNWDQLFAKIDKPAAHILHTWSPRQIVIWDNTQTMHKAMSAGIIGKRLMWRTQARIIAA
ncbi:hypothetical protein HKX48_000606 [Thoreauomyces humboldtii]|nr:hypothetical protein HKX48_000606 [Thoreauomyces humboldtii]